jgi:hypothetical protein
VTVALTGPSKRAFFFDSIQASRYERLETTAVYTTPSQRDLARVVETLEHDDNHR